jgi:two-component system phosphate regulon sensor histidine kinase PhoR
MSSRRVPFRLVASVACTTLVVAAICGAVIHWAGRHAVYIQQVNDLDRLTLLVRDSLPRDGSLAEGDRVRLSKMAQTLGVRVTLISSSGNILLDTDATANLMDNHNDRPEVIQARAAGRQGGRGDFARRSHTLDEWSVYVARLLDSSKPNGVVVRISQWRNPAPMMTASVLAVAGAAAVSGLGAGLALWFMLRKQWVVPLRNIRESLRDMAAQEFLPRAAPGGSEDVRGLAGELNELASLARKQLFELRYQRADVRSLADTIPDAVLVTDADNRITLLNAPAASLLDVKPDRAIAQRLVNVVSDEALIELVDAVHRAASINGSAANVEPSREIQLVRDGQHLTFHAHAERTAGGGALVVLRDVSKLSETVQMKADFVANASHELRTPIAAIKMAFETLREVYAEDPKQTERCLGIIEGHMLRLEEMLRDLLDLSRVESEQMKPYLRELTPADLFASLRSTMSPMARQKNVELHFTEHEEDSISPTFVGDERLLNLVLKNLVENSIKFTPPGGSVTVAIVQKSRDGVTFTVTDTGAGIPPEHLDRVFERFYQVDPARSGSAGRGPGLGLAIVKHAVHAMGGTVQLRSTVGRGTVVTFVIPQNKLLSTSANEAVPQM